MSSHAHSPDRRRQQQLLLQAMLPARMISKLKSDGSFLAMRADDSLGMFQSGAFMLAWDM